MHPLFYVCRNNAHIEVRYEHLAQKFKQRNCLKHKIENFFIYKDIIVNKC